MLIVARGRSLALFGSPTAMISASLLVEMIGAKSISSLVLCFSSCLRVKNLSLKYRFQINLKLGFLSLTDSTIFKPFIVELHMPEYCAILPWVRKSGFV